MKVHSPDGTTLREKQQRTSLFEGEAAKCRSFNATSSCATFCSDRIRSDGTNRARAIARSEQFEQTEQLCFGDSRIYATIANFAS